MIKLPSLIRCPGCGVNLTIVVMSPPSTKRDWQFQCRNIDCVGMNYTKSMELKGKLTPMEMARINLDIHLLMEKAKKNENRPIFLNRDDDGYPKKDGYELQLIQPWSFGGMEFMIDKEKK